VLTEAGNIKDDHQVRDDSGDGVLDAMKKILHSHYTITFSLVGRLKTVCVMAVGLVVDNLQQRII
jgi:hypothetical protein